MRYVRWLLVFSLVYWVSLASAGELVNGDRTQSGTWNYCADAGSTDAYACSHSPALPGYTTGTRYTFKANTANTGAATLNLDSLGAKTLKKMTGAGYIDLEDNDIKVSSIVDVIYDGTNMVLISQLATATKTIASGATALATNAISSGTCATAQTATATGTATTDVILASFNGDVTAVTGYTAATTGTLRIDVYPTSNTVNIRVCNNTSADITPGSVTLNWRVVR